jgi:thiol-disulfide isomerase/thioredoxin
MSKLFLTILLCVIFAVSISAQTTKIDAQGLKNLLPNKENKKPLLLNFWATWCGPCRVEFPELVEIDKDYRPKGLNFTLVSVDDWAIIDTRVPEFLTEYEATEIPSYLLDYPTRPKIAKAVRQIAPGFVDRYPLTLLFNTNGKLVYQKVGVINAKLLRREIDKTLKK